MKTLVGRMLLSSKVRKSVLLTYDVIIIQLTSLAALLLRFEFELAAIPAAYIDNFVVYAVVNTLLTIVLFHIFRFYKSLWMFAGSVELLPFHQMAGGKYESLGIPYRASGIKSLTYEELPELVWGEAENL